MIKNVKNNPLHLTLREMQTVILSKQFVIWIMAAVIILTTAGPFGTLSSFNTLERFAYWLILTPTTFLLANFCAEFTVIYLSKFGLNKWVRYGIAGTLAGIPVGISVWVFQFFVDNQINPGLDFLTSMIAKTIPITFVITMIYGYVSRRDEPKTTKTDSASSADLFFSRISQKLGRDIVSLNAQDHYVEVKTALGSELILMRMSDAISELTNVEGFQTHRSWWVARKHVLSIQSSSGKKHLVLTDETIIPVSRNYAKNIPDIT